MLEPRRELTASALAALAPHQAAARTTIATATAERPRTCLASLDPQLRLVAANAEFYQQFGVTSTDVCGSSLYDVLHPGTQAVLDKHFARLTDGARARFTERVLGMQGADGVFSGELTGMAVWGETDNLSAIVVLVRPDSARAEKVAKPVQPSGPRTRAGRGKSLLTQLDARILEGVAAGASTVQLATRLYLSRQGVEYHVGTMLKKLRVSNRAALVSRAYSMGLLTVGSWPPRVVPEVLN